MRMRRSSGRVLLACLASVVLLAGSAGVTSARTTSGQAPALAGASPATPLSSACGPDQAWIGGWESVTCLDADGWTTFAGGSDEFPGGGVQDVAVCADGTSWLATTSGLVAADGTMWQSHDMPTYASLDAVACDASGGVWLAAYKGVHHFDGQTFTSYPATSLGTGKYVDLVKDVAVAPDGHVWVATANSVATFDGTRWTYFEKGKGFDVEYYLEKIAVDARGRVWVTAGSAGLLMYDRTKWTVVKSPSLSSGGALAIDPKGRVWVATSGGVSMYDGRKWIAYTHAKSKLPADSVRSLAADARGRIWIGTEWGLAVLDGTKWTVYHMADSGVPDNEIRAIAVAADGPSLPALVAKEPGTLTGHIVRGGTPQAGMRVEICAGYLITLYIGSTPCSSKPFLMAAKTDASGGFTFTRVPVGRYSITFLPSGGKWTILSGSPGLGSSQQLVKSGETTDLGTLDLATAH